MAGDLLAKAERSGPNSISRTAVDMGVEKTDLSEPELALLLGQGDPTSDLQPLCDPTMDFVTDAERQPGIHPSS
ncbi:hypothetical protein Celaphus_00008597 [Cervus elaphus hippelaphus]|uniref:Uncharacterized protein n=1 Tax=Cervus elaphus hippelaphus TaxID=46360 RepID=A0A212CPD1_CEREH|nr:hypothetical protein Celaphus_00008597 [Cervus elaphus hippelaphus]